MSDVGLNSILENCCKTLKVRKNSIFSCLPSSHSHLPPPPPPSPPQSVEVLRCPGITPNGFAKIGLCKNLEVLRLTGFGFNASLVTYAPYSPPVGPKAALLMGSSTGSVSSGSGSMTSLPSAAVSTICGGADQTIVPYCYLPDLPVLGELILYNSLVSNDAVRKIFNACPLEDVSFRCCPGLTDDLFADPMPNVAMLGSLVMLLGNISDQGTGFVDFFFFSLLHSHHAFKVLFVALACHSFVSIRYLSKECIKSQLLCCCYSQSLHLTSRRCNSNVALWQLNR